MRHHHTSISAGFRQGKIIAVYFGSWDYFGTWDYFGIWYILWRNADIGITIQKNS